MDAADGDEVANKNAEMTDNKIDTSIVARRTILSTMKYNNNKQDRTPWHKVQQCSYPLASVYCSLNAASEELVDFIGNHEVVVHFPAPSVNDCAYSEEEARMRYLQSKATCYVIFGKPGLQAERLAESIATARNCVFISATRILRRLIDEDEDFKVSKCASSLQCGCDGREDALWSVLLERVGQRDVLHRGYVLEGLPILRKYREQEICEGVSEKSEETVEEAKGEYVLVNVCASDESVHANLPAANLGSKASACSIDSSTYSKSIETVRSACSIMSTETVDSSINNSSSTTKVKNTESCGCKTSEKSSSVGQCSHINVTYQLEEVFEKWKMKPDIIINIDCPDDEVLSMRSRKSCDCSSASSVEYTEKQSDTLSDNANSSLDKSENCSCDEINSYAKINSITDDFECQLQNYTKHAVGIIEKFIIHHNPQNVIRIDGRYPIEHLIETIKIRLQTLPLQLSITPEKLCPQLKDASDEFESENGEDEDYEDEADSFSNYSEENLNLKRAFDKIKRIGAPSENFQWKLSRWKFLCPIELAKGRKIEGKKKLSVRFGNWVFFLSSYEAMEAFIENPRPYLLPPNPRPYCKIAIIGPRYSGKTKLSSNLAREFDSVVICVRDVITKFNQDVRMIDVYDGAGGVSSDFKIDELPNAVAEDVESLPEQDCGDFRRNVGWILDGVALDFELCKKLLENDVSIDTAIVLYESEPYSNLIDRWYNMQDKPSCSSYGEEVEEPDFEEYSQIHNRGMGNLSDYEEELKYYESHRKAFAEKLADIGIDTILCDLKVIRDASSHVISEIRKEYELRPEIIRVEEGEGESMEEEEEDGVSSGEESTSISEKSTHPLGDCNEFCPIALIDHGVLWRGKDEFSCLLDDKIYLLSSDSALSDFVNSADLQLPFKVPFPNIPCPRIFIIGPPGSGKTTLSKLISKEYGFAHIDFFQQLDVCLQDFGIDIQNLKAQTFSIDSGEESDMDNDDTESDSSIDLYDRVYKIDKSKMSDFYKKYIREGTSLPDLIAKECFHKFFSHPFDQCGIIVDSYPNCIDDCKLIIEKFATPDIVIELKCDFKDSENRLMDKLITEWTAEQEKKMQEEDFKFSNRMNEYVREKENWVKAELLKKYKEKKLNGQEDVALENSKSQSLESMNLSEISDFTSVISYEEEVETEGKFEELYPEPEYLSDWESEESARERFSMQIEQKYDRAMENMTLISDFLKKQGIPTTEIDAKRELRQVFLKLLCILAPYFRRNSSFFEKVYDVDNLTAESLLSSGCYFLSPFGRFCPVQLHHRQNPFQMFLPLATRDQIFTVLHRQYVYFLAGESALAKFKEHPLKYLNQDPQMPMIPVKMSVIGPPECGKTTLSKRFSSTYEFEAITRDEAINYCLSSFPQSNLSETIRSTLQDRNDVPPNLLAAVVKLFLSNPQCVTQGCVFDGFPATIEEMEAFNSMAISPIVVIDLTAPLDFTLECLGNQENHIFLTAAHIQIYDEWKTDAEIYRKWLNDRYANVVEVDATLSKAAVWRKANEILQRRYLSFLKYVRETGYDKVYDLEFVRITPDEIQEKVSRFKLYCPGCIQSSRIFKAPDLSKSRKGLVQFREYIYWFCQAHFKSFENSAESFLTLYENISLPDDYPQVIIDDIDLDNRCWSCRLLYNGYCLVTYVDNFPDRKLIPGKSKLGSIYKNQLYLFCSQTCRSKFSENFLKYSKIQIHYPHVPPAIDPKKMPTLGYLEQFLAPFVIKAASRVGELRPKLPGLSPSESAAVYFGAYLKAHFGHPLEVELFQNAMKRIEARCKLMESVVEEMKGRINPWLDVIETKEKVLRIDNLEKREPSERECEMDEVKICMISTTDLAIENLERREPSEREFDVADVKICMLPTAQLMIEDEGCDC